LASLVSIFQKNVPDVVFHLAAETDACQIDALVESNILFGTQLLEAMTQTGTQYFVNTGSYWQHYQGKGYNPVNFYAATKEAFENILKHYTESGSIQAVTLKLFDVYGPGDERNKLFNQLNDAYLRQETLAMSPGEQKLDLVYVDDVVEAYSRAADLLCSNSAAELNADYAVTSLKYVSLKKVVELYQRVSKRHIKINFGARPYRDREVMIPWKGKPVPGWKARVPLETGIRLTVAGKDQPETFKLTSKKIIQRQGLKYVSN
jgi:nucleoside-diphosphate-sugar epimerase